MAVNTMILIHRYVGVSPTLPQSLVGALFLILEEWGCSDLVAVT